MKETYQQDSKGNITGLSSLFAAAKYFEKTFREYHMDNPLVFKFDFIGFVEGDYISDYIKTANENAETNDLRLNRYDIKKHKICWVAQVSYKNEGLQLIDKKFYYIIFRQSWYQRWADYNYPRLRKYHRKAGITLKTDIIWDAMQRGNDSISTLVLVLGDCSIYYKPIYDIRKWSDKIGVITDKWNQIVVGIPKDELLTQDPNRYE